MVVLANEIEEGSKYLAAYLTSNNGDLTTTDLRNYLKDKLPDYMIPSYFVFLDKLPLTPNGKIDRKALPEPDGTRPDLEHEYVPPRTPEEETLVNIFQEVLGVDQVGIKDNFFGIGGDSIQAIQVVSAARRLGLQLSTRDLFDYQEIGALAAQVTRAEQAKQIAPALQNVKH